MIQIRRCGCPQPLLTGQVRETQAKIREMVDAGETPKSSDFPAHWGKREVREALWTMQNGKCCYCERLREVNRESDIEHFRPKARVTGDEESLPGYWWLAYEWKNLFFSCRYCNQQHKKNQFPLVDEGKRAAKPAHLELEESYLINPESEDPETLLGYDWARAYGVLVFPFGTDEKGRGKETIRIVGLDRAELNEERARLVRTLDAIIVKMNAGRYFDKERLVEGAKRDIELETSSALQYAGFRRAFFRAAGLGEYIARD